MTKWTVNAVKCFLLFRRVTSVTQNVTSVTHKDMMCKHLCWMLTSIALTFHTCITYRCCNCKANCYQVSYFTEMLYLIHGVHNYSSLHVTSVTYRFHISGIPKIGQSLSILFDKIENIFHNNTMNKSLQKSKWLL